MKYLALALLAFSIPAMAQSTIVFTWTNNNAGFSACSSTVTSACLVGQTLTDTTSGNVVLSSSIKPTDATYTTPLPAFTTASRTYSLVLNYKDASGIAQATSAATATVAVPFVVNPPTGFKAVSQ